MAQTSQAILVVDLAFGDCGKGTIVDYLTCETGAHTVVRFNGGPQAGHNVVTADGRHHTFSQFGSGSFVPGVRTVLSRFMLIEPYAMLNEAAHLTALGVPDPLSRLLIDRRCPVITPAHQAANRLEELARGDGAFGTCGLGIGQTMRDLIDRPDLILRAGDLHDRSKVQAMLHATCDLKLDRLRSVIATLQNDPRASHSIATLLDSSWIEAAMDNYRYIADHAHIADESEIARTLRSDGTIIFEGAQGVLLDETFGFHPHTTWSTTTFANADAVLNELNYPGQRKRVGVLRSYFTRHGAGPFVTEDDSLRSELSERHNSDLGWQGRFRVGLFDAVAARYAVNIAGPVDLLAITHMDRFPKLPKWMCLQYEYELRQAITELHSIEHHFEFKEGKVLGIRPTRLANLNESARRTEFLLHCRPELSDLHDDRSESFLGMIESELKSPIGIISRGPMARDKEARGAIR